MEYALAGYPESIDLFPSHGCFTKKAASPEFKGMQLAYFSNGRGIVIIYKRTVPMLTSANKKKQENRPPATPYSL